MKFVIMRKRIAVVYGGYSGESVVSEKSARMIMDNIDTTKYEPVQVRVKEDGWWAELDGTSYAIDKNDFSFLLEGEKITFHKVFNIIHGTPGEDGLLQGYLEMLNIPHTSSETFTMSLTFNKAACNMYLKQHGFNCAQSMVLRKTDHYSVSDIVQRLGLPCFIKPNEGGSSIGISRVEDAQNIPQAIEKAFNESDVVILEEFISGREVTCGVITRNTKTLALPITEIISDHDFFDFQAKYEGKSQEITPADVDELTTAKVQQIATEVYSLLNAQGMIRIDFLLNEKGPYIIEVNTVPGFSEASIIPQQAAAAGISKKELITILLES